MREDSYGVFAEIDLFDVEYPRQLLPAIRAGQLGMSWRGSLEGDVLRGRSRDGLERRVGLREFGPVTFPAYPLASVA